MAAKLQLTSAFLRRKEREFEALQIELRALRRELAVSAPAAETSEQPLK
jgi:hypothetical protein